ncbi:MAG TPA: sugar phosphate isomerase/epimerase [Chitinophagaceae bacterium]|nr:sugar phosphate isomerase/epimerase [Chitinophagaceae bacterium]
MKRRTFLRTSAIYSIAGVTGLSARAAFANRRKLPVPGIQLYMVKEDMEADAAGTLGKLAKMGYTQIESFDGNKGMFWGMTNNGFNKLVKDNGMQLISSHYNDDKTPFEEKAARAAEIGMKYLICPWKGPQKHIDDFKRIADEFNRNGQICKRHGLRFGYHSHDYPFKPVDGQLPEDVLLANTDPALVDFQMDFYYVVTEGKDPEAYLTKYRNRYRLCHMRDVLKTMLPEGSEEESACDLGTGRVDYPKLISTALNNGVEYFFVEQSRFYHETPLESAKINADYLKKL